MFAKKALAVLLTCGALTALSATTASAATGQVTAFINELLPLKTWDNPYGCHRLPLTTHVLLDQTDDDVTIYSDPFCLSPLLTVAPGYGAHVSGVGSFSA